MTVDSIEEDIVERAKNKMVLDHLVIQPTSGNPFSEVELAKILEFAAQKMFEDKDDDYEVCDIEEIMRRAEIYAGNPVIYGDGLMDAFKTVKFEEVRVIIFFFFILCNQNMRKHLWSG